ncbi:MAG TPA: helix-turn-helix domain-containing protein [Gaiellaceae bacterium]|nr:helix-turn-helix domain-containing protein [Gaiellaceae bacterium]
MFEIGNSLREARERQGVGYPEIELATKIRAKYIRALEEEDFTSIPGDAYIRGFLRTYADYLGLDGDVYVDEYASRFITSWRDELPPRTERPRIRTRGRPVDRRVVLIAFAGVVVVAALVFAAFSIPGSSTRVPGLGSNNKQHHRSTPARQLVLEGVKRGTYVEVRRGSASGKLVLQGTVAPGQTDRIPGDRFYFLVRTPAGLHITLDGRAVALPAARNHRLRVLVTPQRTTRLGG